MLRHFSLARLMAFVLAAALVFAALRDPFSPLWASLIFLSTLLTLLLVTLGYLIHRRVPWAGFALFGWVALFVTFSPLAGSHAIPMPQPLTATLKQVLSRSYGELQTPPGMDLRPGVVIPTAGFLEGVPSGRPGTGFRAVVVPYSFLQSGNCVFSLLSAGVGGAIARAWAARHARGQDGASRALL